MEDSSKTHTLLLIFLRFSGLSFYKVLGMGKSVISMLRGGKREAPSLNNFSLEENEPKQVFDEEVSIVKDVLLYEMIFSIRVLLKGTKYQRRKDVKETTITTSEINMTRFKQFISHFWDQERPYSGSCEDLYLILGYFQRAFLRSSQNDDCSRKDLEMFLVCLDIIQKLGQELEGEVDFSNSKDSGVEEELNQMLGEEEMFVAPIRFFKNDESSQNAYRTDENKCHVTFFNHN